MNFFRTGFSEQIHDTAASGSANDRIINQNHTLAFYAGADGAELDTDLIHSLVLSGRDECAANVFILDQTDSIRDPRGLTEPQRSIQTGVRCTDHNVSIDGMLCCQNMACF